MGSVYTTYTGGVLFGVTNGGVSTVKNSFAFGDSVFQLPHNNNNLKNQNSHGAFGRTNLSANAIINPANNAYVKQSQGCVSAYEDASVAANDEAVGYDRNVFATSALARLNTDISQVGIDTEKYTVAYSVVDGVDYPVLTYYDKAGKVVVRRVAHTTDNVGENTLAKVSPLFAHYSANVNDYYKGGDYMLGEVKITNAADLLALSLFFAHNEMFVKENPATRMGITGVKFTNDIDMTDLGIFENEDGVCVWDTFLPIGASSTSMDNNYGTAMAFPAITVDGQGHVIKNWQTRLYSHSSTRDPVGSLFTKAAGTKIKNLGMEDALIVYDKWRTAVGTNRAALMVGKVTSKVSVSDELASLTNCWATGKIIIKEMYGLTAGLDVVGGLVGWDESSADGFTMTNCWSEVDLYHQYSNYKDYTKVGAFGKSNGKNPAFANVYYLAGKNDKVLCASPALQTAIVTDDKAEAAWELNKKLGTYWTLNASNGITKGTEATQIRKLTLTAEDGAETVVYGKSGETVNLANLLKLEDATFTPVATEAGSIADMTFTFGVGDDAYTFQEGDKEVEAVDAAIEAIGEVTLESEAAIAAAREAYEALTDKQKALVTKLDVLEEAEAELASIKTETEGLPAYITAIEAAKNGLEVIDKDASAVTKGIKFITTEELAAFEAAVAEAKAAECQTKAEVAAVKAELDAAKVALLAAVKEGTFVAIIEADELKNDFLYKDGVRINNYVLAEFEDDVYFVSDYHRIEKDQLCYIGESYLLGTDYKPGYYYFNAEGKMSVANGPVGNLFLIDGVIQDAYKVYSYGENFYYTTDGRRLAKNTVVYLSTAALAGTGLTEGYYAFDENGVMTAANGVIGDYFYENGTRVQAYTLVTDGEDIYYVSDCHKLAKNKKIYLTKEALAEFGKTLPSAYYDFDADGKLVLYEGPVGDFFYIDGARQVAYQLYVYDNEIYYTTDYHKLAKDKKIYLTASVIGDRDIKVGYHYFDEDGKLAD